jgi:hypothetical protein
MCRVALADFRVLFVACSHLVEDGDAKLQRAAKRRRVQGGGSEKSEFPVLLTSHE